MDFSSIGNLIVTLIGTSAFGSLVGGIIGNQKNRYDKKIDYLLKSRNVWRNEIKEVYQKLQECNSVATSSKRIDEVTLQLQRLLNPNGFLYRHVYDYDGHIWNELDKLKKSENEEQFQKIKQTLLLELDFLLQEDLEKSKKEVVGKVLNVWNIVFMLLLVALHSIYFFIVRGDVNLLLFASEIFLLTIYGFIFPNIIVSNAAQKIRSRKDKTIKANLTRKKMSKIGKVFDIGSSLILVLLVYLIIFLFALSSQVVKKAENLNYENRTQLQKQISMEYNEAISEYEHAKKDFDREYVYIMIAGKAMFRISWGFLLCYFIITFFFVLVDFLKKRGEVNYREKVIKAQLLANDFYVNELNGLISVFEQRLDESDKDDIEIEMILRIIYIRLDEICSYLKESNYSRKQLLESYEDVKKEVEVEQAYKDISSCLKEFGKNGNKLLKKKKNVVLLKDFLDRLKGLRLERLC